MLKEKTHLFDYYKNTDDKFMRRVVHELKKELKKNDSLELKLTKLGAPLWNVISTVGRETDSVLYIPVKALQQDSITAVLAFVQKNTRQDINVHIITGEGPEQVEGLLNSEFILFFQTALYGQTENSDGTIIVLDLPDEQKSVNIVEICFWVVRRFKADKSELLNWDCYYTINITGTTTPEVVLNEGNDLDGGGGGTGEGNQGSDDPRPLDISEMQQLNITKNILKQGHCPNATAINQVWNGITFNIDQSQTQNGLYNHITNTVTFNDPSWLANSGEVLHEVFHAYQNFNYPSGLAPYIGNGNVGRSNIEFEAYLYEDLWLFLEGLPSAWTFKMNNESLKINYQDWLLDILTNGLNSETLSEYSYWLEEFRSNTSYSYPINNSLNTPQAISNLFEPCGYKL